MADTSTTRHDDGAQEPRAASAGDIHAAGLPGRAFLCEVQSLRSFLDGIGDRIEFVANALRAVNAQEARGASAILFDMLSSVMDRAEGIEEIEEQAATLAEIAAGAAPILPHDTTEEALFQALKDANGTFGRNFIARAGLAAAGIYRDRFAFPTALPGQAEEFEALREAVEEMGNAGQGGEVGHG